MDEQEVIACDILITGAGMAGCIAAMSLHRDFRIVLLEKGKNTPNYLAETLIASGKRIFGELNMQHWLTTEDCRKTYRASDGSVSYWEDEQPVYTDALFNPEGENFIVRKNEFLNELRKLTFQLPFPCPEGVVQSVQRDAGHWKVEVKLNDGLSQWYKAKQVIDASGRSAVLSAKLGVQRTIQDKLICISAAVDNPSADLLCKTVAGQNGWWFFCPVNENRLQLSYYTDSDLIGKELTKAEAFGAFLNEEHGWKKALSIEELTHVEFLGTHAAHTSRLEQFSGPGWVAIGDAAMCFDPLSSQGSYKAMATAMQLSHLLKQHDFISTGNQAEEALFCETFNEQMENIWSHYKQHHSYYYGMARKESIFWKRRNE